MAWVLAESRCASPLGTFAGRRTPAPILMVVLMLVDIFFPLSLPVLSGGLRAAEESSLWSAFTLSRFVALAREKASWEGLLALVALG